MKLVRFSTNGQAPRLGVLQGDRIADLQASLAATLARRGVVAPRRSPRRSFPAARARSSRAAPPVEEAVACITEWVTVPAHVGAAARAHRRSRQVHLHRPQLPRPRGGGEPAHSQGAADLPEVVERHHRPGRADPAAARLDPARLGGRARVWSSAARRASSAKEQALDYVWGYTIINDISARDFQFITSQWAAGKIADTFAPVGPYIADRTRDSRPARPRARSSGSTASRCSSGNTRTFIFNVSYLVSYLSGLMTLSPGDLIATGTPPGVGLRHEAAGVPAAGRRRAAWRSPGWATIENPIKDA